MSRSVVVSFAVLALLQAAFATTIDVSKTKNIEIQFTDEDVVPKTELKNLMPKVYADGFIGDLEIGRRHSDEILLRRIIVFNNPTDYVQSSSVTLNVNGIAHYLRVINDAGSKAVVCDHSNTLGTNKSVITIRVSDDRNMVIMKKRGSNENKGGKSRQDGSNATEKSATADLNEDENQGFGNWLRSSTGVEMMRLFVIANSILVFVTMAWPNMKESFYILKDYLVGEED